MSRAGFVFRGAYYKKGTYIHKVYKVHMYCFVGYSEHLLNRQHELSLF